MIQLLTLGTKGQNVLRAVHLVLHQNAPPIDLEVDLLILHHLQEGEDLVLLVAEMKAHPEDVDQEAQKFHLLHINEDILPQGTSINIGTSGANSNCSHLYCYFFLSFFKQIQIIIMCSKEGTVLYIR